eukprot:gene166-196_t
MFTQVLSLSSALLLLMCFTSSVDSTPTTFTSFNAGFNFTLTSLTTGETLQDYRIDMGNSFVASVLQCSGNDYMLVVKGDFKTQKDQYNISHFDSSSGVMTTKSHFYIPKEGDGSDNLKGYNSIDMTSGLAFGTYCPFSREPSVPYLLIFNLNDQSSMTVPFHGTNCSNQATGVYDSSSQSYYLYGDRYGEKVVTSMVVGIFSLVSNTTNYVEFPYHLAPFAFVQALYNYQSTTYACIIQPTFIEVLQLDFTTQTVLSVFKVDIKVYRRQFMFDQAGGNIVALMVEFDSSVYNVYTINLQTLQYTATTLPIKVKMTELFMNTNEFCAQ